MSHGHSHHAEEHPQVRSMSGIYLALIVAGFVVGLLGFVQSMSATDHHDDTHGTEHHTSVSHSEHSWNQPLKPLEFSSNEILAAKQSVPAAPAPEVAAQADSSAVPAAADTTAHPEEAATQQ